MDVFLHAFDPSPSRILARIQTALVDRRHSTDGPLNRKLGPFSFNSIAKPDVVLTALSSHENAEEIGLGEAAIGCSIPWVVVADSVGSWARPPARGKVGGTVLLTVSPREIKKAQAFGYGRVVHLGGSPLWREAVAVKPVPIERRVPASAVILLLSVKDGRLTDQMLEMVIEAMEELGRPWELIFRPHREPPETQDPVSRARILSQARLIDTNAPSDQLLKSVDLTLCGITSSTPDTAALQRAPIIALTNDGLQKRLEDEGGEVALAIETGACALARPGNVDRAIKWLLTAKGAAELSRRQAEVFPIPSSDERQVEERIVDFLEELVGRK